MIVALLGTVIIVYAAMLPREKPKTSLTDDFLESVGGMLQQFADELEEENRELLRMVGEMKREHEIQVEALQRRIEQLEARSDAASLTAALLQPVSAPASLSSASAPAVSAEERAGGNEDIEPLKFANTVRERYRDVFELYDDGKSIDYIARKLGKNKGEVQLILSLARQEEKLHDA